MPLGTYKTLGEALRAMNITEAVAPFLEPTAVPVSDYFRAELALTLRDFDVTCSEAAVCESLIFPILREALKPYAGVLALWSHVPLYQGDQFLGVPDYVIAKRSPLSVRVMDTPFALIVEAKKNDFDAGWAQCLAAMQALQDLNGEAGRPVYGVVSDGFSWRFGRLLERALTRHPLHFDLTRLDELLAACHGLLELCRQQVLRPVSAA